VSNAEPPIARFAPGDKRVRGAPLAAYWFLLQSGELGFVEFTELKASVVERGVHVDERTARFAIRRLVERGYLEEDERAYVSAPGRYRLRWGGRPLPNSLTPTVAQQGTET
jgi:hypothetical protein